MATGNDATPDDTLLSRVDEALSVRLAKRVRAKANQCYWNSLKVLTLGDRALARYDPLLPTASYVEGWLLLGRFPLAHGWLHLADGRLVDVTLPSAGEGYRYLPAKWWECREAVRQYRALPDTPIETFPLWSGGDEGALAFLREYLPAELGLWETIGIAIPDELRRSREEMIARLNDAATT